MNATLTGLPAVPRGYRWLVNASDRDRNSVHLFAARQTRTSVCGYAFDVPTREVRTKDRICARCLDDRPRCIRCGRTVQQRADGTAKAHQPKPGTFQSPPRRGCTGVGCKTWTVDDETDERLTW